MSSIPRRPDVTDVADAVVICKYTAAAAAAEEEEEEIVVAAAVTGSIAVVFVATAEYTTVAAANIEIVDGPCRPTYHDPHAYDCRRYKLR